MSAEAKPAAPFSAALIGLFAIGSLIAVAHHPEARSLAGIGELARLDRLVHGAIIALFVALGMGLATLSQRLGFARFTVRSAMLAFVLAAGAAIAAMAIDGFVVADAGERFANAPANDAASVRTILVFAAFAIQVLTKLSLTLMALATLLWSIEFLQRKGAAAFVGGLGLLVALASAGIMLFSDLRLTPHSLMAVMGAQNLWFAALAALMLARRV